jgi:pyruvate-formate lyase
MRGADKAGPTAVLHSAIASGYSDVCCSAVLNQKFNAALLDSDAGIDKLAAYTNAYMKAGGSHIQYNILDSEQLKEAKAHPEEHQDLIVRIGGFSAYFVQLSKGIQDDVIYRSEFEL